MIINIGQRTDIPSFYSDWFFNRIEEGFVCARNPYYPKLIKKFILKPDVVDCLVFCTKNPSKIVQNFDKIKDFKQFWFITITPYGKDIEPNSIDKKVVIEDVKKLSKLVGYYSVSVRYDPIIINEKYTIDFHLKAFTRLVCLLDGFTPYVVISFVDLYKGTKERMPTLKSATLDQKKILIKELSSIASEHNMALIVCGETMDFEGENVLNKSCLTKEILEKSLGKKLTLNKPKTNTRPGCFCFLGNDIGEYNTCLNNCQYCYATTSFEEAKKKYQMHNPHSPLLIGEIEEDDIIKEADPASLISNQINLF